MNNLIPDIISVGLAPPFLPKSINLFEDFVLSGQIGKILNEPAFLLKLAKDFSKSPVGIIRKIIPLSLSNLSEFSIQLS